MNREQPRGYTRDVKLSNIFHALATTSRGMGLRHGEGEVGKRCTSVAPPCHGERGGEGWYMTVRRFSLKGWGKEVSGVGGEQKLEANEGRDSEGGQSAWDGKILGWRPLLREGE